MLRLLCRAGIHKIASSLGILTDYYSYAWVSAIFQHLRIILYWKNWSPAALGFKYKAHLVE